MKSTSPYPKPQSSSRLPEWRGYTLDEIRYRRVLVGARMEIEKYKLSTYYRDFKERNPFFGGSGESGRSRGIFSRIMGAFTYTEYAIMAFKLFRRVIPLFRRKK